MTPQAPVYRCTIMAGAPGFMVCRCDTLPEVAVVWQGQLDDDRIAAAIRHQIAEWWRGRGVSVLDAAVAVTLARRPLSAADIDGLID